MALLKVNLDWDEPFFKGDSIDLPSVVNEDISTWKIRAVIFDECGNCIRLATSNVTGGADIQILITDGANGKFTIFVIKDTTDCFADRSFIEVEREDSSGKIRTIIKQCFPFKDEELTWTDNT